MKNDFSPNWEVVDADAVVGGSKEQARNVLQAAIDEIITLRHQVTCRCCGEDGHGWHRCPDNL